MATIQVYHQEENRYYQVNVNLASAILQDAGSGRMDYYLTISTNLKKRDGTAYPTYKVTTLADVPAGTSPAPTTWTELVDDYVSYFVEQSELGQSSSSSTSSSSSSSSLSSESSSSQSSASSSSNSSSSNSSSSSSSA